MDGCDQLATMSGCLATRLTASHAHQFGAELRVKLRDPPLSGVHRSQPIIATGVEVSSLHTTVDTLSALRGW